jgi:hypothetical protein
LSVAAQAGEAKPAEASGTEEGEVSQEAASSLHEWHVSLLCTKRTTGLAGIPRFSRAEVNILRFSDLPAR